MREINTFYKSNSSRRTELTFFTKSSNLDVPHRNTFASLIGNM